MLLSGGGGGWFDRGEGEEVCGRERGRGGGGNKNELGEISYEQRRLEF